MTSEERHEWFQAYRTAMARVDALEAEVAQMRMARRLLHVLHMNVEAIEEPLLDPWYRQRILTALEVILSMCPDTGDAIGDEGGA